MPTASDGKQFPYTKEGMMAYQVYEGLLMRNTKKMAVPKRKNLYANTNHPMNTERTTSNPSGKYST